MTITPTVYFGNYVLVSSNSILFKEEGETPIDLHIRYENSPTDRCTFRIRIRMIKDESQSKQIIVDVDALTNTVIYTCVNFDDNFGGGSGTSDFTSLGVINGKTIYVQFWIYHLGSKEDKVRRLEYTVWQER